MSQIISSFVTLVELRIVNASYQKGHVTLQVIGDHITSMDFLEVSFSIHIYNVLMASLNEELLYFIMLFFIFIFFKGEQIGGLEDVEGKGSIMKVRVKIDINEPLRQGI